MSAVPNEASRANADDAVSRLHGLHRRVYRFRTLGMGLGLLPPVALADAQPIAERIRGGVAALEFPRQPPLRCSVSIGIAEPLAGDDTLRGWMEAADRALYRAKAAGRNRVSMRRDESAPAFADR